MTELSGHLQEPATHLSLPVHFTPQAPQLLSSEFRLTQEPPQLVEPVHITTHWPERQESAAVPPSTTEPTEQAMVHEPQWSGSLEVSTHTPLQLVVPCGQPQVPLLHTWPAGQILPQVPQLSGSVAVLVQAPAQEVCPVAQVVLQMPPVQTWPSPQAMAHRPQCLGSLLRFAHWGGEPHEVLPTGQVQVLLAQTMPPVHFRPQPPQLLESEVVSTQAPPQPIRGAPQVPVQLPWLQT